MTQSKEEKVSAGALKRLLEKQDYKCAYTGMPLTPELASLDHIVPLSLGGSHGIENITIIHHDVNKMKGVFDLDRFVELCKLVALHHNHAKV